MALSKSPKPIVGRHNQNDYSGLIQISFMSTGTTKIRPSMRSQPVSNQRVFTRRLRAFCDRGWTEPLPIGVFLISHPDGPILYDTGESPHRDDPGFMPSWSPAYLLSTVAISREEGILNQLRSRGIEPSTLQAVVLSHLHGDHAGGLQDLVAAAPNVPIYVSKEHWDAVTHNLSPLHAKVQGFNPQHWPADFSPKFLLRTDNPVGPWQQSSTITSDGKVVAVDTPGHVAGHVSLVVYSDDGDNGTTYFLAGDATYGLDILEREEPTALMTTRRRR